MTVDLHADYIGAGFSGALEMGARPALLLVDMVNAYLDPRSPLCLGVAGEAALAKARLLAAAFDELGAAVFLTKVEYAPGLVEAGHFARKVPALRVFQCGSPFASFPPQLEATNRIVVTKHYASAFFGSSLASTLAAAGADTVVIGGFSTSGCVRATALDALQYGFIPFVAADACADRDVRPHDSNLFDLQAKYAEVRKTEEIVSLLKRRG